MSTFYLFALILVAVIVMVLAITKLKMHPFIVLTVIAIGAGSMTVSHANDSYFGWFHSFQI